MADGTQDWKIRFYRKARGESPPKRYILALPKEDRARAFRCIDLPRQLGTDIKMPHSKHLSGTGLWELRPKPHRLIYWLMPGRCFVILHAFPKKSGDTKKKDIDLALRRIREVKERLGI